MRSGNRLSPDQEQVDAALNPQVARTQAPLNPPPSAPSCPCPPCTPTPLSTLFHKGPRSVQAPWPGFSGSPGASRAGGRGGGRTHHADLGLGLRQHTRLLGLRDAEEDAGLRAELQDAALQAGDEVAEAADAADAHDRLRGHGGGGV